MNILILHNLGDPLFIRESVRSLEYMFPEEQPNHTYIVHDIEIPFPEYMKEDHYDLIILGATFLGARRSKKRFNKVKKEYGFVKNVDCCKIALPQDDYDASEILDNWMLEWGINRIYTVCPKHWNILYPKCYKKNIINLGYTGYISEKWINKWTSPSSHDKRKIDISYRAVKNIPTTGSLGKLKWKIAEDALIHFSGKGLILDISNKKEDAIFGEKWHNFIENSKCTLVSPSGSSLHDPRNIIRNCINRELTINSNISYEEIEDKCFKNKDYKYEFTAISPRNIEAALANTVQIAIESSYSNIMEPYADYIPLNKEFINVKEIISIIKDNKKLNKIANNCKEKFLSIDRLRRKKIVEEIISFSTDFRVQKKNINKYVEKYNIFYNYNYKKYWVKKRLVDSMKGKILLLIPNKIVAKVKYK